MFLYYSQTFVCFVFISQHGVVFNPVDLQVWGSQGRVQTHPSRYCRAHVRTLVGAMATVRGLTNAAVHSVARTASCRAFIGCLIISVTSALGLCREVVRGQSSESRLIRHEVWVQGLASMIIEEWTNKKVWNELEKWIKRLKMLIFNFTKAVTMKQDFLSCVWKFVPRRRSRQTCWRTC